MLNSVPFQNFNVFDSLVNILKGMIFCSETHIKAPVFCFFIVRLQLR